MLIFGRPEYNEKWIFDKLCSLFPNNIFSSLIWFWREYSWIINNNISLYSAPQYSRALNFKWVGFANFWCAFMLIYFWMILEFSYIALSIGYRMDKEPFQLSHFFDRHHDVNLLEYKSRGFHILRNERTGWGNWVVLFEKIGIMYFCTGFLWFDVRKGWWWVQ